MRIFFFAGTTFVNPSCLKGNTIFRLKSIINHIINFKTMINKGIILVCLASLLSVFQLNSQDRFSIGPRVGLNFSNVSNIDDTKSRSGLAVGLTSTYSINEATGITVDLLASHEGFESGENDLKLTYLQIPILFNVFFGELGQPFRPKVYAGIVPGFLLGAKFNDEEINKDDFNSLNLALGGGLGFNARVANRIWLNADLRAYLGLNDTRENPTGDKQALSTIQPSIGLAYGISKVVD